MSSSSQGLVAPPKADKSGTWKSIKVHTDQSLGSTTLQQQQSSAPGGLGGLYSPNVATTTPGSTNQFMRMVNPAGGTPRGTPANMMMQTGPRFTFQNTTMATLNSHMNTGSSDSSNNSSVSSGAPSPHGHPPRRGPPPRGGPPPPRVGHTASRVEFSQPKLNIVKDPRQLPTPTLMSEFDPVRDFSAPAHKYPARKVDSRSEAKVSTEMRQMALPSPRGIPSFVGTSFTHLPNHFVPLPGSPPPRATVPRMYSALTGDEYANVGMMLNNRTASGRILGHAAQRFIADAHVPYLPPEEPVGPENPYVAINDTWTKCWDKEAGAVYYYNQLTGEATWIAPDI